MARHTSPTLPLLMLASALLSASAAGRAQLPGDARQPGLSGYVVAPDGTPVSGGRVVMRSPEIAGSVASIEQTGRFRLIPSLAGTYQLSVSVPGLAPYRLIVAVPSSRTLRLPVIQLSPATYFRVRFLTAAGEVLTAPLLRGRTLDGSALPIEDPSRPIDSDGAITVGPLPRGVTIFALDNPPLAQTRLPDVTVTGAETLLDGGNMIVQPGVTLDVDVVDETGRPVPNHYVALEENRSPAVLGFPLAQTNQQGRASFNRLSDGRYWLRTSATALCDNKTMSVARLVTVPRRGRLLSRLVVGGQATFRLTSSGALLKGASVSAVPDGPPPSAPTPVRGFSSSLRSLALFARGCSGTTDDAGRVTLKTFPPGPARLDVRLNHSTYVHRVNVPEDGRELAIALPDGFLPVRVTSAAGNQPVAGAALTWAGGEAQVEATAEANGEALLESVGLTGGTLTITAPGYLPAQLNLSEPSGVLQEIALHPAPVPSLQLRVVSSGAPLPDAVVELSSENPMEVGQVAAADAKGFVRFADVPPGRLRLLARADGFVTAGLQVSADDREEIVLSLFRGHRVVVDVQLPAEAAPCLVRVVNEAGTSMEHFLDSATDRHVEPPARLSLGPLAPGVYTIELHGAREHRQQRVRILDGDVYAIVR